MQQFRGSSTVSTEHEQTYRLIDALERAVIDVRRQIEYSRAEIAASRDAVEQATETLRHAPFRVAER
jgi:hypothetical protein